MITILTGEAPNLPWWKCLYMSDEEIKAYNYKYLKETEMRKFNTLMAETKEPQILAKCKHGKTVMIGCKQCAVAFAKLQLDCLLEQVYNKIAEIKELEK